MKRILTITAALLVSLAAAAQNLSPKYPCTDGMVIQQSTNALFWGHADPGSKVQVKSSWDTKTKYTATAGEDGVFRVELATPKASYEPQVIAVKCGKEGYVVSNVLVGEVWIAGGQSNMEMPVSGFHDCPVEGSQEVIASPADEFLRMFTVKINVSKEPLKDVKATDGWVSKNPWTVKWMSATAYFYAAKLRQMLDVPVGIVSIPRGGSRVEGWLPFETVKAYGEDLSDEYQNSLTEWHRASIMYNAMQQPVCGYTARGFIWYQGCSNVGHADQFVERMTEMVRQWREDWGDAQASMPFYQVEIAPYNYGGNNYSSDSPELRAAQHKAASVIPNSAIISTVDLVYPYETEQIHPAQKRQVGERLAYLALHRDYGFTSIDCYSPEAVSAEFSGAESIVHVKNTFNGVDRWEGMEGLEVAGEDGVWYPATKMWFEYGSDRMHVLCSEVPQPAHIRYCWGDFCPGNIHTGNGLPLVPFCF